MLFFTLGCPVFVFFVSLFLRVLFFLPACFLSRSFFATLSVPGWPGRYKSNMYLSFSYLSGVQSVYLVSVCLPGSFNFIFSKLVNVSNPQRGTYIYVNSGSDLLLLVVGIYFVSPVALVGDFSPKITFN